MNMNLLYAALGCGLVALLFAWWKTQWINKQDPGTARMLEIGAAVREGAMAFLKREYKVYRGTARDRKRTGFPDRRHDPRNYRNQRSIPHRPWKSACPRGDQYRADAKRKEPYRSNGASVHGKQGKTDRKNSGACQRQKD